MLDARLFLGDSSAFDVSSMLLHELGGAGVDLRGISSSALRVPSRSTSPSLSLHPLVVAQMVGPGAACIVVELHLPPPPPPLNIACPGLMMQDTWGQIEVERTCLYIQLLPLIPFAAGSLWRITVLGVAGAACS